jgi:hypothetical protein
VEVDQVERIRRRGPTPVRGDSPLRKGIGEPGRDVDRPRHSVSPRIGTVSSSRVDHGYATPDIIHCVRTMAGEVGGGFTLSKATTQLKTLRAPPWRADSRYGSRVSSSVPNLVWVSRDLVETRSFTPEDCCPPGASRFLQRLASLGSCGRRVWEEDEGDLDCRRPFRLGAAGRSSKLGRRR